MAVRVLPQQALNILTRNKPSQVSVENTPPAVFFTLTVCVAGLLLSAGELEHSESS